MTPDEKQQLSLLLQTPGWEIVVRRAKSRIEAAKLEALMNPDESKVLILWHRANAAHEILEEFIQEVGTEIEE